MTHGIYVVIFMLYLGYVKTQTDWLSEPDNVPVPSGADNKLSDGNSDGSSEKEQISEQASSREVGPDEVLFRVLESKNTGSTSFKKWHMGTVPYYIDEESYDQIIIRRIRAAMKIIESASCVVFKNIIRIPSGNSFGTDWLHITNPRSDKDCVHNTRVGHYGEMVMILGFECIQKRDILHALLHVLGFKDEVTHPQRDSFIRVLWENIQPQYYYLFAIQNEPTPYQTLVEYDTMSIMHFHDRAFSSNGGATVTPLISGLIINPSDGLSQLDKMKLRLAFGHECNKRKVDNLFETCKSSLVGGEEGSDDQESDGSDNGKDTIGNCINCSPKEAGGNNDANKKKDDNPQLSGGSGSDDPVVMHRSDDGGKMSEDRQVELKGSQFGKVPGQKHRGK